MNEFITSIFSFSLNYWPFLAAIGLGLILPIFLIGFSDFTKNIPDHAKLSAMFALIVLGTSLATAFSGRVIISEADLLAHPILLDAGTRIVGNYWPSRLAHLFLLSISFSEIFLWVLRKKKLGPGQMTLWSAVMVYYFLSVIVSGAIGNFRVADLNTVYAPIVFTGAILLSSGNFEKTLRALRWILLIPLLGSIICIWFVPSLVLENGYKGVLPGITFRLAGLTEHANSLGVISSIAWLLEFSGFIRKRPNLLFAAVSTATLLLSQSKTAWIIVIIGAGILLLNRIRENNDSLRSRSAALGLLSAGFFLSAFGTAFLFFKIDAVENFFMADRSGLVTFTGRTKIWAITWEEFLNNPISGYGPSIWDLPYRIQHGMTYVGQAHNQYIQTLGQAGLIGVVSLFFYIYLLISRSFIGWKRTGGVAFMLVMVLLVRGFSESPMRMLGIMDLDSFVHLLAFAAVAASIRQSKAPPLKS